MIWLIGLALFISFLIYLFGYLYGAKVWHEFYLYEQKRRNEQRIEILQLQREVMALEDALNKRSRAA